MDYYRHRNQKRIATLPRVLLAGFAVLSISAGIFGFYKYKAHPEWTEKFVGYAENIKTWIAERKNNIHHGINKVANNKRRIQEEAEKPVDFEFYSTLQEMQSMQAEAHAEAQRKLAEKEKQEEAYKAAILKRKSSNIVASNDKNASKQERNEKTVKVNHAADLENDLLSAIKNVGGR